MKINIKFINIVNMNPLASIECFQNVNLPSSTQHSAHTFKYSGLLQISF